MPILAAETSLYPPDLLDESADGGLAGRWFVVQTAPRQEKAVARSLLAREVPFFLPLMKKTHLIRRRRVTSYVPLFPSYVFVLGDEPERTAVLRTNRVLTLLHEADGARLHEDLRHIRRLTESDQALAVAPLQPGRRVRVKQGAFAGLEGTIVSRRRPVRLFVALNVLQQSVSVEIEEFLLEVID